MRLVSFQNQEGMAGPLPTQTWHSYPECIAKSICIVSSIAIRMRSIEENNSLVGARRLSQMVQRGLNHLPRHRDATMRRMPIAVTHVQEVQPRRQL
jgi:hypothetical protein